MTDRPLDCWRVGCTGTLAYRPADADGALYRCRECGEVLPASPVEQLAEDDGPLAELCRVLLQGGSA